MASEHRRDPGAHHRGVVHLRRDFVVHVAARHEHGVQLAAHGGVERDGASLVVGRAVGVYRDGRGGVGALAGLDDERRQVHGGEEGGLKRGPNPNDTYYDMVDLAPYLRKGKNEVKFLLWYFGKSGFSHKSSGQSGMIFDSPSIGLVSDSSWLSQRLDAYTILWWFLLR